VFFEIDIEFSVATPEKIKEIKGVIERIINNAK